MAPSNGGWRREVPRDDEIPLRPLLLERASVLEASFWRNAVFSIMLGLRNVAGSKCENNKITRTSDIKKVASILIDARLPEFAPGLGEN